ncbi:conserved hypothetical protein [Neospora caninum Liverpool]|uniref:Uncharacterized protein n=1 Tax=Neospora caninum (strain Liverpool) TaxID=572307 RepID=F0VQC0_NEOCL|nr:conserved hypothetical protein [Neospora caninum Liverpool]CBZ55917.1 conserved hypothetical protein [Neospora caninum Liverpool]|eukprot:XP_003885943.1 conserved hypothetical protein [Neospora caninum Liverpool]
MLCLERNTGYKAKAKESAGQLEEAKETNRKLTEDLAAAEGCLEQVRTNTVTKTAHDEVKALLCDAQETIKSKAMEMELVKQQLQAEREENAKLQTALSSLKQPVSRGARRGLGNQEAVAWAEQQPSPAGVTNVLRELEKLRSSIKAKDQRGRQLQEEVSQTRAQLDGERRRAEKAQQQLACFMQRMDSLRRHRVQTEARACRQAQEIAALRAELASEKENRQILLQILELYVPDVVVELRHRMQKMPPSFFALDPRVLSPSGQMEKFAGSSTAPSPCGRVACRSLSKPASDFSASRPDGRSPVYPSASEFRAFPPSGDSRVLLPSSPGVPRSNVATESATDWTGSRGSTPEDRLRLLKARGLSQMQGYGDEPSESEAGPVLVPNLGEPVKHSSSAAIQLTVEQLSFDENVRAHDEAWTRGETPPLWCTASDPEAQPLSSHVESVADRESIPPPTERTASSFVKRVEESPGHSQHAGQKRTKGEDEARHRALRVCSEGPPDNTSDVGGAFPVTLSTRPSPSVNVSFITPMAPPTPHCQPTSPRSLPGDFESESPYGEPAVDGQRPGKQTRAEKCSVVSTETSSAHAVLNRLKLHSPSDWQLARGHTTESPLSSTETEKGRGDACTGPPHPFRPRGSEALNSLLSHEDDWCIPQRKAGPGTEEDQSDQEVRPHRALAAELTEVQRKDNGTLRQQDTRGVFTQDSEPTGTLKTLGWSGIPPEGEPNLTTQDVASASRRDCEGRAEGAVSQGVEKCQRPRRGDSVMSREGFQKSSLGASPLSSDTGHCRKPPVPPSPRSVTGAGKSPEDYTVPTASQGSVHHPEEWISAKKERHVPVTGAACGVDTTKGSKEVEKRPLKSPGTFPAAPECGSQHFREKKTFRQKERTLAPLPPNDMALALQEAKIRWQIQYYAAMHKFYSMQLQQNTLHPSEEPEDRFFPDILAEGVDADDDPTQMSMEELLAHSNALFEDAGLPP